MRDVTVITWIASLRSPVCPACHACACRAGMAGRQRRMVLRGDTRSVFASHRAQRNDVTIHERRRGSLRALAKTTKTLVLVVDGQRGWPSLRGMSWQASDVAIHDRTETWIATLWLAKTER